MGSGFSIISIEDTDPSYVFTNPALLNRNQYDQFFCSQSFNSFFANRGSFAYALPIKGYSFMPYLIYSNYGQFEMRDETGNLTGEFSALDYVIGGAFSKELSEEISYGLDVGFLGSHLENYNAFGVKLNAGLLYQHKNDLFSSSIILKDVGYQLLDYNTNVKKTLLSNLAIGASYKLKHAPFRFSLVLNELNNWKNYYINPFETESVDLLTGDTLPIPKVSFLKQIGHHVILQTELFVSNNVCFRSGFNYHRRNELMLETRPGMAGFSLGIGVKTKTIELNYGYTVFSKAAQSHGFSMSFKMPKRHKKFLG